MADFFGGFGVGIIVMALSWWVASLFLFIVRPVRRLTPPVAAESTPTRPTTEVNPSQGG